MPITLVIIDLDGVLVDSSERFAKAEEAKQQALALNTEMRQAIKEYWRVAFTPDLVSLDTLIEGADKAVKNLESHAYTVVFMTSRPESMREATQAWLDQHDLTGYELVMKPAKEQFTKTVEWKAKEVRWMANLPDVLSLVFIDDERVNREAVAALGLGVTCKENLDDYKPDDQPIFA